MHAKTTGGAIKSKILSNQHLANEIPKPITKRFKRGESDFLFQNKIWGTDLSDMQLKVNTINKFDICHVQLIFKVNVSGLFLKIFGSIIITMQIWFLLLSKLIIINCNEPLYYPFAISIIKFGGSCNTIDDPYTQIFVPDKDLS